jgi:SAM-dependent methyltransferase
VTTPYAFYNTDDPSRWGRPEMPEAAGVNAEWLARADVPPGTVLELGCGKGALATDSALYVGLDLSLAALKGARRRICGDMEQLPLATESVAFLFTWAALEHVPHPELVLGEIERVLSPRGVALLAPAWHCRPWAAEGLEFRPFGELRAGQRVRKALIPLRNAILWRALFELPRRLAREWRFRRGRPLAFDYGRLEPNLEAYMGTDSDAFTSMDPHAAAVYFASRGWEVLSHPTRRARLTARHEPVVVRKPAILSRG